VLPAGSGVVLALTAAQVIEAMGANAAKLYELDEVPDAVGDSFALGYYGGAGGALKVKTVSFEELDYGTVGAALSWDLAASQSARATLSVPCTITILPNAAPPGGSGHFQLLLFGTDTQAVTFTNILFTGSGPDLTTSPVWTINVYPDRAGIFRATATPFAS
jgi:hypothetical protein